MSNLGVGVMIQMLSGNKESVNAYKSGLGKQIASVDISDNVLTLNFSDDTVLKFRDDGQSCCESRYMVCDDDVKVFEGAVFIGAELLDGPSTGMDTYEVHEVQFLHIATSMGKFTISNHNEHNGYYGGFALRCSM